MSQQHATATSSLIPWWTRWGTKMKPQNQTLYFSMFQPKKWARAKVEFEAVDVFILTNLFSFRLWTTHPLTEIVAARQFTYGSQFSIQCFLFQVWWHFSCCVRRIKTCKNISKFTEAYGSLQGVRTPTTNEPNWNYESMLALELETYSRPFQNMFFKIKKQRFGYETSNLLHTNKTYLIRNTIWQWSFRQNRCSIRKERISQ